MIKNIFFIILFFGFFAKADFDRPRINQNTPTENTCYLYVEREDDFNHIPANPQVQWGYVLDNPTWIGPEGLTDTGFKKVHCGHKLTCKAKNLTSSWHYFAARYIYPDGSKGQWSPAVVACKP